MGEVERERKIVDLLGRAIDLDGPGRRRFLDRACAGDRAMREELDSLLEEESECARGFLEVPAAVRLGRDTLAGDTTTSSPLTSSSSSSRSSSSSSSSRSSSSSSSSRSSSSSSSSRSSSSVPAPTASALPRFGPYRVIEVLGKGGMGTVYLAEQRRPVRRRVALKVIDAVQDRRRLKRFAAEGQALARLNHPNVASLYEVGAAEEGRPFVVMELVEGIAITDWCDQHRLALRDRIELFFDVCAGVRHAHEKGVLHRDLKPANVLVTEVDGRATAKVIDFGIARALGESLLESSSETMTQENQLVGSPVYMCPELAAGERDTDTRGDVYALGLLLYQLLIGALPFKTRDLGLVGLLKRIAKGRLPAPSVRFAGFDLPRKQKLARQRSTDERALSRRLQGDLDAITGKALARDPADRYSSPSELAADLQRHLDTEPVEARPSTTLYVAGRFLRRRAGMVLATGLLVLVLLAGFVASTREAKRANLEAERASQQADRANKAAEQARESLAEAQKVSRFLVELFEIADPERIPGEPVDVRQLLDRGAERLEDELGDQPLARALFLHTIGDVYTKMALLEPAETLIVEALAIRERELPTDHPDVLESVNQLGVVYRRQEKLDQAEPLLRRVLATHEAAREPDPSAIALALNNLGNLLWSQERLEEAEVIHRRALVIRERELEPNHPDLAETLNNLGALFRAQDKYLEARPILMRAVGIYAETLGTDHPRYGAALFNLALILRPLGQWRDAESYSREALTVWEAAYGPDHPRSLSARSQLAILLREVGRYEESVRVHRSVVRQHQQTRGADDPRVAGALIGLAISLGYMEDFGAAETHLQRALAINLKIRGEDHSSTINVRSNLAWLAWLRGDHAEAEAAFHRVLEARRRVSGPEHSMTAWALHYQALAIADQGRASEAEAQLRQALEIRERVLGEGHVEVADSLHELGRLAQRAGRGNEAQTFLDRALEIRRGVLPAGHPDLERTLGALASFGAEGSGKAEATGT